MELARGQANEAQWCELGSTGHTPCSSVSAGKHLGWVQSAVPRMSWHPAVLVLTGVVLIFFLVAGTVLCFGFRVRAMLIIH